jgi:hypothetical protein
MNSQHERSTQMDAFEAIAKRYSHKVAFDPKIAVSDSDLLKIVEAGMRAQWPNP